MIIWVKVTQKGDLDLGPSLSGSRSPKKVTLTLSMAHPGQGHLVNHRQALTYYINVQSDEMLPNISSAIQ